MTSGSQGSKIVSLKRSQDQLDAMADISGKRPNKKKKRFTSAQRHTTGANICIMNENATKATKIATVLGEASYKLPLGHPGKQTTIQIVDDVNKQCGTAISHQMIA